MYKFVYLITTYNCSACKCMKDILYSIKQNNPTFTVVEFDYFNVPEFIKDSISLTDFPTTIFVEDGNIKYHFTGTLSEKKVIQIMDKIGF